MPGKSPRLGICLLILLLSAFFGFVTYSDAPARQQRYLQTAPSHLVPWPAPGNELVLLPLPLTTAGVSLYTQQEPAPFGRRLLLCEL